MIQWPQKDLSLPLNLSTFLLDQAQEPHSYLRRNEKGGFPKKRKASPEAGLKGERRGYGVVGESFRQRRKGKGKMIFSPENPAKMNPYHCTHENHPKNT